MQLIIEAFQGSLTPHKEVILKSTQFIQEQCLLPGYTPLLMRIVADPQKTTQLKIKQAALANLGLQIQRRWPQFHNSSPKDIIPQEDRNFILQNIFEAVVRAQETPILFGLYKKILKIIAYNAIPKGWKIINIIEQSFWRVANINQAVGLFNFVLAIASAFQFNYQQGRVTSILLAKSLLPLLRQAIIKTQQPTLIYLGVKSMWKMVRFIVDGNNQVQAQYSQWIPLLLNIVRSDKQKDVQFEKARKNSFKILYRLLKHLESQDAKKRPWSTQIIQTFGIQMIESLLQAFKCLLDKKQAYFLLKAIQQLINSPRTNDKILQHGEQLIRFPFQHYVQLQKDILRKVKQDPKEFLQFEDSHHYYKEPRTAVKQILNKINGISLDWTLLIIQWISQLITKDISHCEAALYLLINLKLSVVSNNQRFLRILYVQVQPLLDSAEPLIQARACQVFAKFMDINPPQIICQKCILMMTNGHLIARVKAAQVLNKLINNKICQKIIQSELEKVVQILLNMLDEIDSQQLVFSLQQLTKKFMVGLMPFAKQLVTLLSEKYANCYEKLKNDDSQDSFQNAAYSVAEGYLQIVRLMLQSNKFQQQMRECKQIFKKMILVSLEFSDKKELQEQAGLLLTTMLNNQKAIEPDMWIFFSLILYKIRSVPKAIMDQLKQIQPKENQKFILDLLLNFQHSYDQGWECYSHCIKIYIQKGLPVIMQSKDFIGQPMIIILLNVIQKSYKEFQEENSVLAFRIFFTIIENSDPANSMLDAHIEMIFKHALQFFNLHDQPSIKVLSLQAIFMLYAYKPQVSIPKIEGLQFNVMAAKFLISLSKSINIKEECIRIVKGYLALLFSIQSLMQQLKAIMPALTKTVVQLTLRCHDIEDKESDCNDFFIEEYQNNYSHPIYDSEPLTDLVKSFWMVEQQSQALLAVLFGELDKQTVDSLRNVKIQTL